MAELCVTLARQRHRMLMAEMDAAAKAGAKLLELRFDYLSSEPRLKQILGQRTCPVIATVRRRSDGGQWRGSEDKRLMLLRTAIVEGVDYVDLELDIASKVPRYGQTKRIVSFHDMNGMPADLKALYRQILECDPDIVKIAARGHSILDVFRMLQLLREAEKPTIAICMGEIGIPSRILGACFGSPFTFAAFNPGRIVAPGLLTYDVLKHVYHYEEINEQTEIYGVIGDPIRQSLSPVVHNAAFRAAGLNKVYVPFQVPPESLNEFMEQVKAFGIRGLSVTIPHKREIRSFGKDGDPLTTRAAAANTIVKTGDEYVCYNTDGPAAIEAVEKALSPDAEGRRSLKDRTVLLLGAGGVAATLAHAFGQKGSIVTIASRRPEQAKELAEAAGCTTVEWSERHTRTFDVVVNCTPLGMYPDRMEQTPFHGGSFKEGMVVFDTVYNPEKTMFLKEAAERNCKTVSGMEMFVGQAEAQFKLFTGQEPPEGLMLSLVREELSPAKNMLREARLAKQSAPGDRPKQSSSSSESGKDEQVAEGGA